MQTRTGPHAFFIMSMYCSGRSRPSFSTARLMTPQRMVIGRTCSTSRTHREVIQAQGQRGSKKKSIVVGAAAEVGSEAIPERTHPPLAVIPRGRMSRGHDRRALLRERQQPA